jgi:hypothetical protein
MNKETDLKLKLFSLLIPDGCRITFGSVKNYVDNTDGGCQWSIDMQFESDSPFDIIWQGMRNRFNSTCDISVNYTLHHPPLSCVCERSDSHF